MVTTSYATHYHDIYQVSDGNGKRERKGDASGLLEREREIIIYLAADTRSRGREHGARGMPATHRPARVYTLHYRNNMSGVEHGTSGVRGRVMHSTCGCFTTGEASKRTSERTSKGHRNGLPDSPKLTVFQSFHPWIETCTRSPRA